MRAQITDRDYEQLSAYIDGQLSPAERSKLEERLRIHSDLQATLDELSRTRALLRAAPRRRAPRNFTLSPAMVGEQKYRRSGAWWNLFPVLSFTSALATLALVASIVFQLIPGQMQAASTAMEPQADQVANIVQQTMTAMQGTMPAPQEPLPAAEGAPQESGRILSATQDPAASPAAEIQAAPADEPAPTEAAAMAQPAMEATAVLEQPMQQENPQSSPPVVAWGSQSGPAGMGEGGYGGGGQGVTPGSLLDPSKTEGAEALMGKGGGGAQVPGQNIVIPQESVNAQDATTLSQPEDTANEPAPAQANPQITGSGPILGVPSAEEGGQIVERKAILGQPEAALRESRPAAPPQAGAAPDRFEERGQELESETLFGLPVMLVLQVLLALIAIATGVAAFIVRRRAR